MRAFSTIRIVDGAAAALRAAIAAAPHDRVFLLAPGEEPDAALRAALDAWCRAEGGPGAHEVQRAMRYLGRVIPCRDWQERGPVRFFDRREKDWDIGPGGDIRWSGIRGRLDGTLQIAAPVSLATSVASIARATQTDDPSPHAGTLPRILARPPLAIARGLATGRGAGAAGRLFAVLDGLHALVTEVRAWERRRHSQRDADPNTNDSNAGSQQFRR